LGNLIESALKKLQDEKEVFQNSDDTPIDFEEKLFSYEDDNTMSD